MTKHLTSLLVFLIPFTIAYAILSSVGTAGNHYGAPDNASVSRSGLSKPNAK